MTLEDLEEAVSYGEIFREATLLFGKAWRNLTVENSVIF